VIDPATGEFKNLGFDPETAMNGKLRQFYDLYDVEEAKKAYSDVQEPYKKRPSTWRTRRMYNRQPTALKSDTSDMRLKSVFDRYTPRSVCRRAQQAERDRNRGDDVAMTVKVTMTETVVFGCARRLEQEVQARQSTEKQLADVMKQLADIKAMMDK
jgi:hypothetical protein